MISDWLRRSLYSVSLTSALSTPLTTGNTTNCSIRLNYARTVRRRIYDIPKVQNLKAMKFSLKLTHSA